MWHRFRAPVARAVQFRRGSAGAEDDGFLAGAQIGYSRQTGQWVFGIEADASFLDLDGEESPFFGLLAPVAAVDGTLSTSMDWLLTARGRVGYAFGDVLLFATGGVAFSEVETVAAGDILSPFPTIPFSETTSDLAAGYTLGAGFEYALTERLSLKAEYQYVDLGETSSYNILNGLTLDGDAGEVDVNLHLVKAGINYRF